MHPEAARHQPPVPNPIPEISHAPRGCALSRRTTTCEVEISHAPRDCAGLFNSENVPEPDFPCTQGLRSSLEVKLGR